MIDVTQSSGSFTTSPKLMLVFAIIAAGLLFTLLSFPQVREKFKETLKTFSGFFYPENTAKEKEKQEQEESNQELTPRQKSFQNRRELREFNFPELGDDPPDKDTN